MLGCGVSASVLRRDALVGFTCFKLMMVIQSSAFCSETQTGGHCSVIGVKSTHLGSNMAFLFNIGVWGVGLDDP